MQNDKIHAYIDSLIPERPEFFMKMEKYAAEHHVPIMETAGMETMLQMLRILQPECILEIGTAIGYSALRMAHALPSAQIVTIERDEERAQIAQENFGRYGNGQTILIKGDALEKEEEVADYAPFDAIFIDAAKGQYKRFFELYSRYLTERGIIITDNVLFKGLVAEETIAHKRTNGIVSKIKHFNEWLTSHPDYDTVILPIGDGVAISKKR
nr:O-methyltransferase [uncultured Bacillus sp.]